MLLTDIFDRMAWRAKPGLQNTTGSSIYYFKYRVFSSLYNCIESSFDEIGLLWQSTLDVQTVQVSFLHIKYRNTSESESNWICVEYKYIKHISYPAYKPTDGW